MNSSFRSRLKNREPLLGTMVTLSTPAVSEIFAEIGFDWLFIDGEHGPLETPDLLRILQAVSHRLACVIRVPAASEASIKRTLDIGAAGVIVPMVNTPDQAADVVRWSRYSPAGSRGVGLARAQGYGLRFQQYVESANDSVAVIVQAEHALAVDNIESIVQVEGIDGVQLGPYDLAASMGKMGQVDDPDVVAAVDHIIATCLKANVAVGCFAISADAVQSWVERGCTLITAGVDTLLLAGAAGSTLKSLRAMTK
ncbi:MAG: aldolase/citrate lyase family protein [Planctomycetaceae bacterium]